MVAEAARKGMIVMLRRQRFLSCQSVDDVFEQGEVAMLTNGSFEILFELCGLLKESLINSAAHLHTSALFSRRRQILDVAPLRLRFVSLIEPAHLCKSGRLHFISASLIFSIYLILSLTNQVGSATICFRGNFSSSDVVRLLQCSQGFRSKARFLYSERQTFMKKDLMKKYIHCFGSGKAKHAQGVFDRSLDFGFKAYMQCFCFCHVNQLLYQIVSR